jgi:hypothetical protein
VFKIEGLIVEASLAQSRVQIVVDVDQYVIDIEPWFTKHWDSSPGLMLGCKVIHKYMAMLGKLIYHRVVHISDDN